MTNDSPPRQALSGRSPSLPLSYQPNKCRVYMCGNSVCDKSQDLCQHHVCQFQGCVNYNSEHSSLCCRQHRYHVDHASNNRQPPLYAGVMNPTQGIPASQYFQMTPYHMYSSSHTFPWEPPKKHKKIKSCVLL